MNRFRKAVLFTAAVAILIAGSAAYAMSQASGIWHVVGDIQLYNNDPTGDYSTAIGEQPTIRHDGSAGAILLGAGDTTAPSWSLTFSAADAARLADTDALAWGAGDDMSCASDGTNVDCTVGTLVTFGDGGTTNFLSVDLDGDMLVQGSGSITLNDNVELEFGTSAGQSTLSSDATDTVWTITLGVYRLDQVALDTDILQFESSDVAHGLTTTAVTSHYAQFSKRTAAEGGLLVEVISENATTEGTLSFDVIGGEAGTTQDNTAVGLVDFLIEEHDGSNGRVLVTANGIGLSIRMNQGGSVRATHLFDEDGDITVDGSATVGTFSEFDDAALAAALEHEYNPTSTTARNYAILGSMYTRQDLVDRELITSMDPELSMTTITKVQNLLVGGLSQQGVKAVQQQEYIEYLEDRLDRLEDQVTMLAQQR